MKNITKLLTTLLILSTNTLWGQTTREESCQEFLGTIHVMVIFSSGPDEDWTSTQKEEKIQLVEENMEWLKGEASKWGKNFTWTTKVWGDREIDYSGSNVQEKEGAIDRMVKSNVLKTHTSPRELFGSLKVDNLVCLVFHKGSGRAYTKPEYMSGYFLEYSVIYERHRNSDLIDNSVVGHEILHLFGAIDLYSDTNENFKKLIEKYCKGDIMSKTGDLSELRVSDIIAWQIGWLEERRPYFTEIFLSPK